MKNPFYISNTGYEQQQYSLLMTYDNMHNILSKNQIHETSPDNTNWTKAHQTTYDLTYEKYNAAEYNVAGYFYTQPHAVRQIIDKPEATSTGNDVKTKIYDYDPNGNLTHITQTTDDSKTIEKLRTNLWDEENRLRAVDITPDAEGIRPIAIYTYDAGGERILKHSNTSVSIYLNGKKVADTIQVDAALYPSGMLVAKLGNNGSEEEQTLAYTKHYFAGTQRVSSKIGTTENLGDYLYDWFTQGTGGPVDVIGSSFGVLENAEQGVVQVYDEFDIEPPVYDSNPVFIPVQSFVHGDNELEQYFFHPDHLGSTSYITNLLGEVSQHMEYFAFGETFVEEHRSSNNSPYKFNGKELDEETGWYYYGARYYDPRLSIFISVDPLVEQTFEPYSYVGNNPINFIDPTGMSRESTHIDQDGNVVAVFDDGDNGVYQHGRNADGGTVTEYQLSKRAEKQGTSSGGTKVGETEHWDEFISPEDGSVMTQYKIQVGKSFDPIIERMHGKAKGMNLKEIASESGGGGLFDIKVPYKNVGALLNGKYATSRSAGNFLAGYNAEGGTMFGVSISFKTFQKLAGALHIEESFGAKLGNNQKADIILSGNYMSADPNKHKKFVSPTWGEVNYQYRMSKAGWQYGQNK